MHAIVVVVGWYRAIRDDAEELWANCTVFFSQADTNHNGMVGMDEAIKFFAKIGSLGFQGTKLDIIRSQQINCSMCVANVTSYYL